MTIRDFFFQIVLLLFGAIIGVGASASAKETQKKIAWVLGFFLIVVSMAWAGYEYSYKFFPKKT